MNDATFPIDHAIKKSREDRLPASPPISPVVLEHIFITNKPELAKICEDIGVSWVMIDLEVIGKVERQFGRNTLISNHQVSDISIVRPVLTNSKLLVRCNPWHEHSKAELDKVIEAGADAVMLPMITGVSDVKEFVKSVAGRVPVFLLIETIASFESLDELCKIDGADLIHIGLNDLSIQLKSKFLFEPLAYEMIDSAADICRRNRKKFGFGGIAQLGEGILPAEKILAEHVRLGSSMVILSRSFLNSLGDGSLETLRSEFIFEFRKIKEYERFLHRLPKDYFLLNKKMVRLIVDAVREAS